MAALAYVRRMRRMNLAGARTAAAAPPAAAAGGAEGLAASWGLNWADKTFGQGLSSLTKGGFARNAGAVMINIRAFHLTPSARHCAGTLVCAQGCKMSHPIIG